jgi:hypothetical protein
MFGAVWTLSWVLMVDPVAHLNAALSGRYRVERQLGEGGIDRFVRLYVTPGANHESVAVSGTTGQPIPQYVDLLGVLESRLYDPTYDFLVECGIEEL